MTVERLTQMANNLGVLQISKIVLDNPRFKIWTASGKKESHHYGKGGLEQHVFEVAELCQQTNNFFATIGKSVNSQQLFLAALFHDVGKLWDYEPVDPDCNDWQVTSHKRNIHHISRSALVWGEAIHSCTHPSEWDDEVLHAILSHHGLRAWGSPVAPASRLAWMLHLCDGLSARMQDFDKPVNL